MASDRPPLGRLLDDARAMLPEMIAIRRTLHRRPEIGLQLPETQAVVVAELERLDLPVRRGTTLTSVTSHIDGAAAGPTILLRADMDALPLQEDTDLPFASEVDGAMHACGHDTHVAMLLGAVRLLQARRDGLAGRVGLMFQPGEEGYHGARSMLAEGLLDEGDTPPSEVFAVHISTRYRSGTINLRAGAMLAANDTLRIVVRGRGGHASTPHLAVDPIVAAAEMVVALQAMVARRVDVFDPAVVTIAHVVAGTTTNVIPEEALLEGTIRSVSESTRSAVASYIREVAAGVAAAYGATADVSIEAGNPVTVNDADAVERVASIAGELLGSDAVGILDAPVMGAEDLATAPQNHSNRVVFDEDAMAAGAALYAAVAIRALTAG